MAHNGIFRRRAYRHLGGTSLVGGQSRSRAFFVPTKPVPHVSSTIDRFGSSVVLCMPIDKNDGTMTKLTEVNARKDRNHPVLPD
jgi:hypothetical protein